MLEPCKIDFSVIFDLFTFLVVNVSVIFIYFGEHC